MTRDYVTERGDRFNLRTYGHPGKYEGGLAIDELVHGLALDGWAADETGSIETIGWHGRIDGPIADVPADQFPADLEPLTDDERAFLASMNGAIVHEDSQGFVTIDYFHDATSLASAWAVIEAEQGMFDDEEDPA